MRTIILLIFIFFNTGNSWANIVINGTRVIYTEKNKEVIVQLINNGNSPALVQSWIDDGNINSTPETAQSPFSLSPPVVKVSPYNGQLLRIKKKQISLPDNRESVFYLNVLDIPPTPDNLKGMNTVQLAIKSRIKLFYRPKGLAGSMEDAINNIKLNVGKNGIKIINNSPFHITIVNIDSQKKKNLLTDSLMIAPLSDFFVSLKHEDVKREDFQVKYVDDFGAYKIKKIPGQ